MPKCNICGNEYSTRSNLARHQRRAHQDDGTQTVVFLPDLHHPHQDIFSLRAVLRFLEDFQPTEVNLLGDAMNMDAIDHWLRDKGNLRALEGKRLVAGYEWFAQDVLLKVEEAVPKAHKVYMGGNHEDWVNIVIDRDPSLEGLVEPEIVLKLAQRNWEWIPYLVRKGGSVTRGMKQYGKLLAFHGDYTNKYHAAKTADTFSRSCVYGHTHDVQSYTKVTVDDYKGYHTAQSIGCLCDVSPAFMQGRQNRWVNAFGILYVRPDGMYNLYVPHIIRGQFTFGGKTYDGR